MESSSGFSRLLPGDSMRIFRIAALILGLPLVAGLPMPASAQTSAAEEPNWTYLGKYGPANWGRIDPSYSACSKGHAQSPVDIRGAGLDRTLEPIEFHFIGAPVTLINNGRGIVVKAYPGSYVVAGGVRYGLIDFTFHHPSEHAVNGDLSDMEVDFLTRSADGKTVMLA